MNKKILFLILLSVAIAPSLALASGVTVKTIADAAEQTTLYIGSAVVVILWVVTGFLFLSVQGQPEKLQSAKKALFTAIAGTVLVIAAASAIYIIGQAFNIPTS